MNRLFQPGKNVENKMTLFTKNNLKLNLICVSFLLIILQLNMKVLYGQEISDIDNGNPKSNYTVIPVLGKHKFMPNSIVRDPFIKTYIRNSVGIGQALDLDIPIVEIGENHVLGLRGDLMFASLQFEYQHSVKDWLAVWGRFNIIARIGNDTQALLSQGITAITGFEFGWLFKLMKKDNTMLSLSLSLENGSTTIINLLEYINRIIDDDYSYNNSLVNNVQSVRGGSGVRFAWSVSKLFGFYATGELLYGQTAEVRGNSQFFYNLGGVLDFDLNAVSDLPFGILVGYGQTNLQSSGDKTIGDLSIFFFRIGYNKTSDLSIGIESSFNKIPLQSIDQTINAGLTKIMLRYYFE